MTSSNIDFITHLEKIVRDRLRSGDQGSYTAKIASAGNDRLAQKVGEEAVELAIAAVQGERDAIVDEAADLIYHLLVLLNAQQIGLADVAVCLEQRHSGR